MTLKDQIISIATAWFNSEFAKMPIPRIIYALCVEAFRRGMEWGDLSADENLVIYEAMKLIDAGLWRDDAPGVAGYTDANKPQCECH